jgi:hypothetical protein
VQVVSLGTEVYKASLLGRPPTARDIDLLATLLRFQ